MYTSSGVNSSAASISLFVRVPSPFTSILIKALWTWGEGGNMSPRTNQQSYSTISIWQNQQWTIICSIGWSNLMGRAHSSLAYLRSLTSLDLLWEEDNCIFWKKWPFKEIDIIQWESKKQRWYFLSDLPRWVQKKKYFVTLQCRWYYTPT